MTTATEAEIQAALKKCGGSRTKAARLLKMSYRQLGRRLRASQVAAEQSSSILGLTRQDFKSKYDKNFIVPKKIKDALKKLGPDRYLPEAEFIRLAGISQTDMGFFRPQFEDDYVVVVERTKRLWCGSKKLAAEFRGDDYGG